MNGFWRTQVVMLASILTLEAGTIATYPAGTLLENIAISPNGALFISAIDSGTVFRISPGGASQIFGQVTGPLLGLAFDTEGTLVAAGGTSLYRFALDGTPTLVTDIPRAADLNGVALLSPGIFLVADDVANTIWKVDLSTGTSSIWLAGGLLVPDPNGLPIGPNGVKIYGGPAYISVTGAGTVVRVPILAGDTAGTPEVFASNFQIDDFTFGADGSIFAATQIGEILRRYPNGTVVSIPTGTLGDAALAFGRTATDLHDLYVVNNGGAFLDLPNDPEDASIVKLTTDTTAAVPEPATLWLTAGAGIALMLHRRRAAR